MDFKVHVKETDLSGMSAHLEGTGKSVAEIFLTTSENFFFLYLVQYRKAL